MNKPPLDMSHRRPQFSLRNLMLAVACFAVAAGWVALWLDLTGKRPEAAGPILFIPVVGLTIGAAIGLQVGNGRRGMWIGCISQFWIVAIAAVLWACIGSIFF